MSDEIRDSLKSGKAVIGTEETMKELKKGKLSRVLVSSNCPQSVRSTIKRYAKEVNEQLEVRELEKTNNELGAICKKPFSISIIGIMK